MIPNLLILPPPPQRRISQFFPPSQNHQKVISNTTQIRREVVRVRRGRWGDIGGGPERDSVGRRGRWEPSACPGCVLGVTLHLSERRVPQVFYPLPSSSLCLSVSLGKRCFIWLYKLHILFQTWFLLCTHKYSTAFLGFAKLLSLQLIFIFSYEYLNSAM